MLRRTDLQATNLRETFERHIAKLGNTKKAFQQSIYNVRLEYVPERDPIEESQKCFQGCLDQTDGLCAC